MSIDAWIREQCSAAVVGPRLRAEGWTMTDEEVEAVLLAAELALPREETAARLAEWGAAEVVRLRAELAKSSAPAANPGPPYTEIDS